MRLREGQSMFTDRSTRPILVTASHRAGTTWIGKMIAQSFLTYYIGEVFHPGNLLLSTNLLTHWYEYVTAETGDAFVQPLGRILAFDFAWPDRNGIPRMLPSRLVVLRRTRRWLGFPRPVIKDPIAAMSAEWLAETFKMDVICLVRHPAAFVASLMRVGWRFDFNQFLGQPRLMDEWLGAFAPQLENPPTGEAEEGALLWLCIYHVLMTYADRHREWMVWRLQDIAREPVSAFGQIFTGLDLPYTARVKRAIVRYSSSTNPVEAPADDPHSIRRDSRALQTTWRSVLTPREIASIRRTTEPVAHRFYSDLDW